MSGCARARELFGPYWDDETTRAEREWLDAHFASCTPCREEYEGLARTLSAVSSLPRIEASPDLAERALTAARRATAAADVVFVREPSRWTPALAAAAAAFVVIAGAAPFLLRSHDPSSVASRRAPVAEPRLVANATPSMPSGTSTPEPAVRAQAAVATITDSLFDHSEDVDFVLDPVTLRRGRAHGPSRLPEGIQGEQAVITF